MNLSSVSDNSSGKRGLSHENSSEEEETFKEMKLKYSSAFKKKFTVISEFKLLRCQWEQLCSQDSNLTPGMVVPLGLSQILQIFACFLN